MGGRRALSIRTLAGAVPPASGAAVMGTGVLSTALLDDGHRVVSLVFLGLAAAMWTALGVVAVGRFITDRPRFGREVGRPASLTAVAGTGVLGARLTVLGAPAAGVALLVVAAGLWATGLPVVLRRWRTPTDGASFLVAVATQSLALVLATLALHEHARWSAWVAVPFLLAGLGLYVFVLARFDPREIVTGAGDQWVTGGALAIAGLAAGTIAQAAVGNAGLHVVARVLDLAIWVPAVAWLAPLLAGEVARPRLRYDTRRWATVFPLGMYAAMSFVVARVEGAGWIADIARVALWVGLVVWALAALGALRQVCRLPGVDQRPSAPVGRGWHDGGGP